MAKVLLINPSYEPSYGGTKVGIINPIHPTLGLATIAATAIQRGHTVDILDMSWRPYDFEMVRDKVMAFKPDVVGITATTPLMNQLRDLSVLIKDISKDIAVVGGGPHVSALPSQSIRESMLDAVFVGEADYSFAHYCDGGDQAEVDRAPPFSSVAGELVPFLGGLPVVGHNLAFAAGQCALHLELGILGEQIPPDAKDRRICKCRHAVAALAHHQVVELPALGLNVAGGEPRPAEGANIKRTLLGPSTALNGHRDRFYSHDMQFLCLRVNGTTRRFQTVKRQQSIDAVNSQQPLQTRVTITS